MSRNLKGTISRPAPDKLFARITAKDANGKTVRPRIPLDPSMSDDDAREMALRMTEAAKGRVWEPPKKKLAPLSKLPTCDEYFEKLWVPSRMGKVKSIRSDLYRYRLHIKPVIGKKRVDEVTADDLRDLVQKLDEKVEDDSITFGAKNAINCWAVASKMFSDLAHSKKRELRLLKKNPAEDVQPPDRPTEVERQWLFPVELQQLLACDDVPVERRLLYAAAVYFCCRPGEVLGLLWRQGVDLQHGMVRVYRAWDSDKQRFNEYTKTGRSRHFAIEPILLPALRRAAEGRTRDLVFDTLDRPYDWLRADLMTAKVERHALHHQRKGSRALRFHDLRATGITYMAMRGDTDNAIRERAGHTDFATTLIYIRRGHLAAGASIGSPFAQLPVALTGIVPQSSKTSSEGDAATINGPPIPQKLRKTAWENQAKNSNPSLSAKLPPLGRELFAFREVCRPVRFVLRTQLLRANPSLSATVSESFSLLQQAPLRALPTGCPKSSKPIASVSALGARCMYLSVIVSVLWPTSS